MLYLVALLNMTKEERKVYKELDEYTADKFLRISHTARAKFMERRAAIQEELEQQEAERMANEYYSSEPESEQQYSIGWHINENNNGCFHISNNASATYYRMKQLDEKITKLSEIIKHINNGGNVALKYGQDGSYRIERTDDLMCELLQMLHMEMQKTNTEFYNYRPVPSPEKAKV